ncbi:MULTISPECIES: hypothetical protein [unclassified Peribacillus]|uniref:hypothetical protein n=1 Tax=unclassified Peribacillus TaxID=2675266 RepID=UPI001A922FA0|nr:MULTISPECIES: hypothetical protein [unclassified Peribacillus]WMX55220.1 hypothetical protein RE409_24885 [Peribacillus sp. R9-11]
MDACIYLKVKRLDVEKIELGYLTNVTVRPTKAVCICVLAQPIIGMKIGNNLVKPAYIWISGGAVWTFLCGRMIPCGIIANYSM